MGSVESLELATSGQAANGRGAAAMALAEDVAVSRELHNRWARSDCKSTRVSHASPTDSYIRLIDHASPRRLRLVGGRRRGRRVSSIAVSIA